MSTVDPELRWWRNAQMLRATAIVLWGVVFVTASATGWSNAVYLVGAQWESWAGAEWLVGLDGVAEPVRWLAETSMIAFVIPVVVAGAVDGYARHRSGGGEAWCITSAFGWTLLGLGLGSLLAVFAAPVPWETPVLLALLGALTLAIRPVTRLVLARRAARQAWSRSHGTAAMGTVTKVDVETISGVDRWKLTLRYDDRTGQTRWHRAAIPFQERVAPRVGDRHLIRYDPDHPGRHSSITVEARSGATTGRR